MQNMEKVNSVFTVIILRHTKCLLNLKAKAVGLVK